MSNFVEIKASEFKINPFSMISEQWMLVTAEKDGKVNTMTASWGGIGFIWRKNVAYIFIRPERYTKEFIDASDKLSLSFFNDNFRDKLAYLGKVSGRDEDKIKNSALTVEHIDNTPYFGEAETVLICKKLYTQEMIPEGFIDQSFNKQFYSSDGYHTVYVVEIEKILSNK